LSEVYKGQVEEYKPCRVIEIYFDKDEEIEIGSLRLKGFGRDIWLMLDGRHTIGNIVDSLCLKLETANRSTIKSELLIVLRTLIAKKMIVADWDPLHKLHKSQEL